MLVGTGPKVRRTGPGLMPQDFLLRFRDGGHEQAFRRYYATVWYSTHLALSLVEVVGFLVAWTFLSPRNLSPTDSAEPCSLQPLASQTHSFAFPSQVTSSTWNDTVSMVNPYVFVDCYFLVAVLGRVLAVLCGLSSPNWYKELMLDVIPALQVLTEAAGLLFTVFFGPKLLTQSFLFQGFTPKRKYVGMYIRCCRGAFYKVLFCYHVVYSALNWIAVIGVATTLQNSHGVVATPQFFSFCALLYLLPNLLLYQMERQARSNFTAQFESKLRCKEEYGSASKLTSIEQPGTSYKSKWDNCTANFDPPFTEQRLDTMAASEARSAGVLSAACGACENTISRLLGAVRKFGLSVIALLSSDRQPEVASDFHPLNFEPEKHITGKAATQRCAPFHLYHRSKSGGVNSGLANDVTTEACSLPRARVYTGYKPLFRHVCVGIKVLEHSGKSYDEVAPQLLSTFVDSVSSTSSSDSADRAISRPTECFSALTVPGCVLLLAHLVKVDPSKDQSYQKLEHLEGDLRSACDLKTTLQRELKSLPAETVAIDVNPMFSSPKSDHITNGKSSITQLDGPVSEHNKGTESSSPVATGVTGYVFPACATLKSWGHPGNGDLAGHEPEQQSLTVKVMLPPGCIPTGHGLRVVATRVGSNQVVLDTWQLSDAVASPVRRCRSYAGAAMQAAVDSGMSVSVPMTVLEDQEACVVLLHVISQPLKRHDVGGQVPLHDLTHRSSAPARSKACPPSALLGCLPLLLCRSSEVESEFMALMLGLPGFGPEVASLKQAPSCPGYSPTMCTAYQSCVAPLLADLGVVLAAWLPRSLKDNPLQHSGACLLDSQGPPAKSAVHPAAPQLLHYFADNSMWHSWDLIVRAVTKQGQDPLALERFGLSITRGEKLRSDMVPKDAISSLLDVDMDAYETGSAKAAAQCLSWGSDEATTPSVQGTTSSLANSQLSFASGREWLPAGQKLYSMDNVRALCEVVRHGWTTFVIEPLAVDVWGYTCRWLLYTAAVVLRFVSFGGRWGWWRGASAGSSLTPSPISKKHD